LSAQSQAGNLPTRFSHSFAMPDLDRSGTFAESAGLSKQQRPRSSRWPITKGTKMRGFLIGALAVGVIVLGYLYWEETRNDASITIEAPTIQTPR
jgi:hypothetical protein